MKRITTGLVIAIAALGGCKKKRSKLDNLSAVSDVSLRSTNTSSDDPPPPPEEDKPSDGKDESGGTGTRMALDEGKMGKKDSDRAEGQYKMQKVSEGDLKTTPPRTAPKGEPEKKPDNAKHKGGQTKEAGGEEAVTRAWFPETFLWNPLVVTDDTGAATVEVRVPDRLTTWHVLALAHSRTGAQGGAVASFAGTLPSYVDLVVPPFLVTGDAIELPVQVVNTTEAPIASTLAVTAEGGTLGPIGGERTIPAGGNLVEYARLTAGKPGAIKLHAAIGSTDAVLRTIEVKPNGKPETVHHSGTLAAPRELDLAGPVGADAATDRVRLVVYPGALALLRSELGVSTSRTGAADDAYALALAGRAPALLGALGDTADPDAIRTLSLIAGQKVIRDARTMQLDSAIVIAEGALAHPQNAVLARLAERAVDYLAKAQRPDGSFGGGNGWTLQRVLVATADGTRAVAGDTVDTAAKQRTERVQTRAGGYIETNVDRIADGYTAAAILASGAASGPVGQKLRQKVLDAVKASGDGAKYLEVAADVVRADGTAPSQAEATAYAILALQSPDDKAVVADLGATLLGSYSPIRGWGDGRANLVAMRAVLQLFKDPVPPGVAIALSIDGHDLASSTLDREALRESLALEAAVPTGVAGSHHWKITATPAVPGLAYSLVIQSWVPWPKEAMNQGLELALPATMTGSVGKPIDVAITATAPSALPIHITEALPAGVQIDTPSVAKLVTDGTITKFETSDGKVELFAPPLSPGQVFTAKYRVIPTLAGTLHAGASEIEQNGTMFHVPPTTWTIAR